MRKGCGKKSCEEAVQETKQGRDANKERWPWGHPSWETRPRISGTGSIMTEVVQRPKRQMQQIPGRLKA